MSPRHGRAPMKLILAAAAIAMLAVPATAQVSMNAKEESPVEKQYQQKLKNDAEADKRYREVVRQTSKGSAPAAVDPWANVRPSTPAKPAR